MPIPPSVDHLIFPLFGYLGVPLALPLLIVVAAAVVRSQFGPHGRASGLPALRISAGFDGGEQVPVRPSGVEQRP